MNKCLDCNTLNKVKANFCVKCGAPLAEMRLLESIDAGTRKKLKLGKSLRAETEKEIAKYGYLMKEFPEKKEKYLFSTAKAYHRIKFYVKEAETWQKLIDKFSNTAKKSIIKVYLF